MRIDLVLILNLNYFHFKSPDDAALDTTTELPNEKTSQVDAPSTNIIVSYSKNNQ